MDKPRKSTTARGRGSALTALVAIVGLALAAIVQTLATVPFAEPGFADVVVSYGDAAVTALAAATCFYAAFRMDDGLSRATWTLIAASVALMALGDTLWAYERLWLAVDEAGYYLSDLSYVSGYAVFAAALVHYAFRIREKVDTVWVATETLVVSSVLGATVWVTMIAPTISAAGGTPATSVSDLTYFFLDFPLMIAPALAVILIRARLHGAHSISPWLPVLGGALTTLVGDTLWFWDKTHTMWLSGSIANFAFMAANVLFAVGAMSSLDEEHRVRMRPGRDRG